MSELQKALIGLGLLFLGLLALWEWRRSRRTPRTRLPEAQVADITLNTERPRRLEPDLGEVVSVFAPQSEDTLEVPSISAVESPPETLRVAAGSAVDVPATARGASGEVMAQPAAPEPRAEHTAATSSTLKARAPIRWPPQLTERVLAVRIVKADGGALPGRAVRIALESAGMVSGPQAIYHRPDIDGAVIMSAANLVHPGTLDPQHMDAADYRGLSLFSVLPGPLPAPRMLGELVATARSIALRLGAVVQDEKGADLDSQRLTELRRSLPADGSAP
jgi:FtsZ-interacting cell division protein ZipA